MPRPIIGCHPRLSSASFVALPTRTDGGGRHRAASGGPKNPSLSHPTDTAVCPSSRYSALDCFQPRWSNKGLRRNNRSVHRADGTLLSRFPHPHPSPWRLTGIRDGFYVNGETFEPAVHRDWRLNTIRSVQPSFFYFCRDSECRLRCRFRGWRPPDR